MTTRQIGKDPGWFDIGKSHAHVKKVLLDSTAPGKDLNISQDAWASDRHTPDYSTLDIKFDEEIAKLKGKIRDYARDGSRRRPLNILLTAEPGSGKSYFVKCLAKSLSDIRVAAVICNMAAEEANGALAVAIDAVRTLKVDDKLPLLFLDEYDAENGHFRMFLPLLWDGELTVGGRTLTTGKIVIVLAGSRQFTKNSRDKTKEKEPPKFPDFQSRINGGKISIPGLDEMGAGRDRRVDKMMLACSSLRVRFGKQLIRIPWAFLRWIAHTPFVHGARSITSIIELIPMPTRQTNEKPIELTVDDIPLVKILSDDSIPFHIDKAKLHAASNLWANLQAQGRTELVTCFAKDDFWFRLGQFSREEIATWLAGK